MIVIAVGLALFVAILGTLRPFLLGGKNERPLDQVGVQPPAEVAGDAEETVPIQPQAARMRTPLLETSAVALPEPPPASPATPLFHARVVDTRDEEPVPGAHIRRLRASGSEEASSEVSADQVSADADGRFTLPVLDGEPIVAIAEAEGFGRLLFTADALHGTPGEAAVIRLRRAASLQARVLAASGGGVAGVEVLVRCEAADLQNVDGQTANPFVLEDEVWRGRTDELGLALLEGLAPGAALHAPALAVPALPYSI